MKDYYLTAGDELTLLDALPDWMTDGVDIIHAGRGFSLHWNIPVPYSDHFHAVLRVEDMRLLPFIKAALADYMTPLPPTMFSVLE